MAFSSTVGTRGLPGMAPHPRGTCPARPAPSRVSLARAFPCPLSTTTGKITGHLSHDLSHNRGSLESQLSPVTAGAPLAASPRTAAALPSLCQAGKHCSSPGKRSCRLSVRCRTCQTRWWQAASADPGQRRLLLLSAVAPLPVLPTPESGSGLPGPDNLYLPR